MYSKALILVLLGSTLVVCSPEAEPRRFHRRGGKPGLIRRGVQRALNFTKLQSERIGRVAVGGTKEIFGVAKDVKGITFGTIGDLREVAIEKWGSVKNGTWGTIGAITNAAKGTKKAWLPPDDQDPDDSDDSKHLPTEFLDQCLALQKNGDFFQGELMAS